ncbi:MAG: hypothetical protein A3B90_02575 [Candidatus Magasanikbacteria bacterium RIFCSPHIGHO2_02_FULL_41_13]|uniref:L-threonylcarbamoyladenylate synthase n=1 Tax=Candidatus Magasanikbacteria bacterium RIFCSPHIGHO2_02_FULL_41_13 TaxID=1798676 RepID=A0A1F6M3P7_9BACT|nr:MAG: hypothetical protein A3B90_02575 [Candidatus Magasanikbacteria bacterium RIFCSPHIGHO2_02_FULL_41_13]
MKILRLTKNNQKEIIHQAIEVLAAGGLVIYPTETCYGIGADATSQAAIDKLLSYKTKRKDKALSIALTDKTMAAKYVEINKTAKNIYDNFLPGPITVVSRGKHKLAEGVESSMGTQGVRIPNYQLILDLLKEYKKPITATSANASYKKTPYSIADILDNTSKKQQALLDLAIDAGRLPKRKPSTVVDTTLDNIYILREGSMDFKSETVFLAQDLKGTENFVEKIFSKVQKQVGKKAIVFLLQGDLGAGKTHFTKYLAKKLKVKDMVVSPTFTLCREYKGHFGRKSILLKHIDSYRFYEASEIEALDPKDLFQAPNIVVVEWANKVKEYIDQYLQKAVVVKINIVVTGETSRRFEYEIE